MPKPPLPPQETLVRVLRLARLDGMTVLGLASFFAFACAMAGDVPGAIFGLLIAGAGALGLHGVAIVQRGTWRGMHWLVGSQLFLLLSILTYCTVRIIDVQIPPMPEMMAPAIDLSAERLNMTTVEYLRFVNQLVYAIFALCSVLYQGGMALYYHRRRDIVRRALAAEASRQWF